MQTMQQQRAEYALKQVMQHAATLNEKQQKEYRSHALALPAMIHINGLGQAAAFFNSKSETHAQLYTLLSNWLIRSDQPLAGSPNLIVGITNNNMYSYRLAQAEAQALMGWVKKFVMAYMHGESEEDQT